MNQRRQNVFESTCFHSDWLDMANDKVTVTFFSVNWMNWDGFDWNGFGSIWLNLAALKWMNETEKDFICPGCICTQGPQMTAIVFVFCLFVGHMLPVHSHCSVHRRQFPRRREDSKQNCHRRDVVPAKCFVSECSNVVRMCDIKIAWA